VKARYRAPSDLVLSTSHTQLLLGHPSCNIKNLPHVQKVFYSLYIRRSDSLVEWQALLQRRCINTNAMIDQKHCSQEPPFTLRIDGSVQSVRVKFHTLRKKYSRIVGSDISAAAASGVMPP
jgi:hypothetical protein